MVRSVSLDVNENHTLGENNKHANAHGGYANTLGLSAGGNIPIGDDRRHAALQPNRT